MPVFIRDGHTSSAYLAENPETDLEAVTFRYRPATGGEVAEFLQHRESIPGVVRSRNDAKFLADHLVEWDVYDGAAVVAITASNCTRLHKVVQGRMIDIICGYAKSDPAPAGVPVRHINPDESLGNC